MRTRWIVREASLGTDEDLARAETELNNLAGEGWDIQHVQVVRSTRGSVMVIVAKRPETA